MQKEKEEHGRSTCCLLGNRKAWSLQTFHVSLLSYWTIKANFQQKAKNPFIFTFYTSLTVHVSKKDPQFCFCFFFSIPVFFRFTLPLPGYFNFSRFQLFRYLFFKEVDTKKNIWANWGDEYKCTMNGISEIAVDAWHAIWQALAGELRRFGRFRREI